jgi:hypothetical protein
MIYLSQLFHLHLPVNVRKRQEFGSMQLKRTIQYSNVYDEYSNVYDVLCA